MPVGWNPKICSHMFLLFLFSLFLAIHDVVGGGGGRGRMENHVQISHGITEEKDSKVK